MGRRDLFGIGGLEAILIRIQLIKPMNTFLDAQTFNELITMHGTTMIFLGVMPVIFALMNAVIPLQIGARDVAFPFLNALGFWTFLFGGILLNLSWIMGSARCRLDRLYPTILQLLQHHPRGGFLHDRLADCRVRHTNRRH